MAISGDYFQGHSDRMQTRYAPLLALAALSATPAMADTAPRAAATAEPRDGSHDFDFLFGKYTLSLKRLKNPLHGSHEWTQSTGTMITRPLWSGKANVEEFFAESPAGRIEALTLRTYSTTDHQWTIYWGNAKMGKLDVPMTGEFKDGRGEFYDQELFEGRQIYVRYIWSNITPKSGHFEQSFSADGGKTWEVNWISDMARVE